MIKTVRAILDAGRIGRVHLVTLQTFRNTHARGVAEWRPDWRRERRYSGGGIAMDHGSHTFYLAFEWLRELPDVDLGARRRRWAPTTPRTTSRCSLTFPTGVASAHLTWNAGVRKVHLHHPRRPRRRPRRGRRHRDRDPGAAARDGRSAPHAWDFDARTVASDWMDSSHVGWFNSLFDDFAAAIDRGEFVGQGGAQRRSAASS